MLPHQLSEPPPGSWARPRADPLCLLVRIALSQQAGARHGGPYDPIALWKQAPPAERTKFIRDVKRGTWRPTPGLRGAEAFADVVNHLWWDAGRQRVYQIPRPTENPARRGPGPLVPMGSADWLLLDNGRRLRFARGATLYADEAGTAMYILRPRGRRTVARVPRGLKGQSLSLYRDWYSKSPKRVLATSVPSFPARGRRVGTVHTLCYTKPRGRFSGPKYHPFEGTHPTLAALGHGQFAIVGGNFSVTRWGILR